MRKPYEHVRLLQSYGYLYLYLYLVAQLQMAVADCSDAVASLEQWFVLEKHPSQSTFALAGSVYSHARRYDKAVTHLTKALALVETPEENWHRQLLAEYYESQQYRAAASLLQEMIIRFPGNAEYWLQLSSVYRAFENDKQSIAVMELAYRRGLLTREPNLTLAAIERALNTTKDVNLYLGRRQILADKEDWLQVVVMLEAELATEGQVFPARCIFCRALSVTICSKPIG